MKNSPEDLTPLLNELLQVGIAEYLVNNDFIRMKKKDNNLTTQWSKANNSVDNHFISIGKYDPLEDKYKISHIKVCEEVLKEMLCTNYVKSTFTMLGLLEPILEGFLKWCNKSTNFDNIFKDLRELYLDGKEIGRFKRLHKKRQAEILASQAIQQVSPQEAVLPTPIPTTTIRDTIISHIEKNDFSYAFRELKALPLEGNDVSWLSNFKQEYIAGKTDHRFVDRLRTFVDTLFPKT